MTDAASITPRLGIDRDPSNVRGCRFCGAKAQTVSATGITYWHAAVNCCAPSALLQLTWRAQDYRTAVAARDEATDPGVKSDLEIVVREVATAGYEARDAFNNLVRNETDLDAAIAKARAAGYDYQFTRARAAIRENRRRDD